ncbi:hypothetical protein LCGC14_1968340 [marine sediment metagenome]|uniref:Uncharacterized protein n=1 Tax=marine sediment metagenome TaxID=412755 RepID=A0A0F9FCH0_9ZZZZ
MAGHHEWECQFLKMDLVPYQEELSRASASANVREHVACHTGMKCGECGITFETWMTDKIRQILKRVRQQC